MSEVKVNKLSPRSGTTVTLGDSGDTFTIPSGVTFDASSGGLAGTLTTAAQPNITSVGTLTSFASTGIDDNATSNAITIDSSENVGIGESSPLGKLHIKSADSGADVFTDTIAILENSGDTRLSILSGTSGEGEILFGDSGLNRQGRIAYRHNGDKFTFQTGNVERMTLNSTGLGIGTSSPSHSLQVSDKFGVDTSNSFGRIYLGRPVSPNLSSMMIQGTDVGETINALSMINNSGAGSSIELDGSVGAIKFNVSTSSTERMRIDSSGNVGIGTTSPTNALTVGGDINSNKLQLASNAGSHTRLLLITDTGNAGPNRNFIEFHNNSSSTAGRIEHNGSTTVSYITSSDYRLKENVSYDFDATTRLKQLKPARFNFIEEPNKTVDGFLAHEVSDIVPEAISGEKDALQVWKEGEELPEGVSVGDNKLDENGNTIMQIQGIDQSKLVPLLVKTIQELEARITQLENA